MKLKTGKEEIVYLLTEVFKKYEAITGNELIRNTNRKNYEELAKTLSTISNQLPYTSELLIHDHYAPDRNSKQLEYPYLKYDITGGQIKDAYNGIVSNPRPFLVDACYIYLYGIGRRGFETSPVDEKLLQISLPHEPVIKNNHKSSPQKTGWLWPIISVILLVILSFVLFKWLYAERRYKNIVTNLHLVPYQPSASQIKSLVGLWTVYIGSPQARVTDQNRYHMVVRNIVEVKYENGYFLFNRYGASFDHDGYMQFENADVVSIHSYVKNTTDTIESPRLSLLRMLSNQKKLIAMSASWNFDVGTNNDIIGIREVYIKQGDYGKINEVINTIENSSCRCKIIRWQHGSQSNTFYLRNEHIDSLRDPGLKALLDEHSILLRQPAKGVLLSAGKEGVQ